MPDPRRPYQPRKGPPARDWTLRTDILFPAKIDGDQVAALRRAMDDGMTAWLTGPGRPDQRLHSDWPPLVIAEDVMEDEPE